MIVQIWAHSLVFHKFLVGKLLHPTRILLVKLSNRQFVRLGIRAESHSLRLGIHSRMVFIVSYNPSYKLLKFLPRVRACHVALNRWRTDTLVRVRGGETVGYHKLVGVYKVKSQPRRNCEISRQDAKREPRNTKQLCVLLALVPRLICRVLHRASQFACLAIDKLSK